MSDVTLSRAIRANLLHLQNTASLMDVTQERLATGLKVNSALDNPTNFFTASSLRARAGDISTLLDAMGNGIRTIEAADNGLTAITRAIESMQSALRQARQDRSFEVRSFALDPAAIGTSTPAVLTLEGGALEGGPVSIPLNTVGSTPATPSTVETVNGSYTAPIAPATHAITVNGVPVTLDAINGATAEDAAAAINATLAGATPPVAVTATGSNADGRISLAGPADGSLSITVAGAGADAVFGTGRIVTPGAPASADGSVRSVDQLVNLINSGADTKGRVRATNDNGRLRIENLSTIPLSITGYNAASAMIDGGGDTVALAGNKIRGNLAVQFNELKAELDRLAEDASYNGVNLLRGDALKIVFNETGTSEILIQVKDADGVARPINAQELGLPQIGAEDLNTDAQIDALLKSLTAALAEVRTQSSSLGTHLSTVQNREDFTKKMMNTLETGAANLTLADTNEEAANLLALQTRQQLSQTALSLASQADQAVLRLFG